MISRRSVTGRIRRLAALELLNILLFGWFCFFALNAPASAANVTGFALAALLLVEGAIYWELKYRQLTTRVRRPSGMHIFRLLRLANPIALAAGLLVIGAATLRDPGAASLPGLAFWLLALLEHINYFHLQLMHDNRADLRRLVRTRRLHRSHLAEDLSAAYIRT